MPERGRVSTTPDPSMSDTWVVNVHLLMLINAGVLAAYYSTGIYFGTVNSRVDWLAISSILLVACIATITSVVWFLRRFVAARKIIKTFETNTLMSKVQFERSDQRAFDASQPRASESLDHKKMNGA